MRADRLAGRIAAGILVLLSSGRLAAEGGDAARGAAAATEDAALAAIVLADDSRDTRLEAEASIRAAGGTVAHVFDGLLVARIRDDALSALRSSRAIREATRDAVPQSRYRGRPRGMNLGVGAWNGFFRQQASRFDAFGRDARPLPPPERDALVPPPAVAHALREGGETRSAARGAAWLASAPDGPASPSASPVSRPFGATDENTSEFLAGRVSVGLFLVESDGSIDLSTENWSAAREQSVVSQVAAGLDWLRIQEPAAALTFVYHVVAGRTDPRARTGYEPITRRADPTGTTGEDLWAGQILAKMGFATGDRWSRSRALAQSFREADGSDWAVNLFVADSLSDADGRFADGYFAYAWVGGPHVVMTYDNQAWGIDRMNQVVRHELLHSFFAFDEYTGSSCGCADHRGYLDGTNANCRTCNTAALPCVMDSNGPYLCADTRRQIGWSDLDGDGADDVIGEDPDTFVDPVPATVCGSFSLSGQAAVVAATNRNPVTYTPRVSISVNRIIGVEWRADGGTWMPAGPSDGAWDGYLEAYSAEVALSPGPHTVEARAVDDHGNRDLEAVVCEVQVLAAAEDPGTTLRASPSRTVGVALSWGAAPPEFRYRVYRSAHPLSGFSSVAETAATAWTDVAPGTWYYLVRAIDACGGVSVP